MMRLSESFLAVDKIEEQLLDPEHGFALSPAAEDLRREAIFKLAGLRRLLAQLEELVVRRA